MGPGKRTPVTFMQIKEGKIVIGPKDNPNYYDNFEGYLNSISLKEGTIKVNGSDKPIKQWNVEFKVGDKVYIWSADYDGYLFQSFINSIANLEDYSKSIVIVPYLKDTRTKLVVYKHGELVKWKYAPEEMPEVKTVIVDGEELLDAKGNKIYNKKERMAFISKLVETVNLSLRGLTDEDKIEEVEEVSW